MYTRICIIVAFNIAVGNGGIDQILLWNCEGVRASRPPFSLPSLHLRRTSSTWKTEAACVSFSRLDLKSRFLFFWGKSKDLVLSRKLLCWFVCVERGFVGRESFSTLKRRCYDNGREACRESRVGMATIFCILIAK